MKSTILLMLAMFIRGFAIAQYHPVDQGSTLNFTVKNFGIEVGGSFTGVKGTITFDPANLPASAFDVTIDAASVNTDNSLRDSHLRDGVYFDVKKYPTIHLVSKSVSTGKKGMFLINGTLTIKKQTKPVSLPFSATPTDDGLIFKGTLSINRRDFEVGGTSTISDKVDITLNVNTKR
jgi:polyisoprenoid-binding protein YceI